MAGQVVAFSGPIGSRKSALSSALAAKLHWPRQSFGDFIRHVASTHGRDPADRSILQQLGQARVQTDPDGFVTDVLAKQDWALQPNLVLDGLRHAEVRHALILYLREREVDLKVVFVDVDESLRQRQSGMPLRELATYDRDLTEAQVSRVIRAYADVVIPGSLPTDLAVDAVISRLSLREEEPRAAAQG